MNLVYGYFGKLPAYGDFVGRGWSDVSQNAMEKLVNLALAETLASYEDGLAVIDRAPCSVITVRPGVLCQSGFLVVIIPSYDRVGRRFPLIAGVQWTHDESGDGLSWPSVAYATALIMRLRRAVQAASDADDVRVAVESVGSPERCASTFCDIGDDDTLPRIPGNSKLLHFSWPLSAVSMHASGVCVALQASSDILGLIFSADGQVQDAFICRRLASGSQLAPIFDGRWVERGWTTYGADPPPLPGGANARVRDIDNEATQPRN